MTGEWNWGVYGVLIITKEKDDLKTINYDSM